MLRWSDQLRIGFCADHLAWVRSTRGFRPRVIEQRVIELPAPSAQPVWKSALDTLADALGSSPKKADALVTLSNRFVRYTVVPWHDALMKHDERLVQSRHCFKQIYGEVTDKWSISVSEGRYRQPFLATAMDRDLIEGLRATFGKAGIRLVSVVPYLTAAYGRFRTEMVKHKSGPAYFGVVEEQDIGALQFESGKLQGVFNQRIRGEWTQELNGMLLQSGCTGKPRVCLFAPGCEQPSGSLPGGLGRVTLPALRGSAPGPDSRIAMVLAGA